MALRGIHPVRLLEDRTHTRREREEKGVFVLKNKDKSERSLEVTNRKYTNVKMLTANSLLLSFFLNILPLSSKS